MFTGIGLEIKYVSVLVSEINLTVGMNKPVFGQILVGKLFNYYLDVCVVIKLTYLNKVLLIWCLSSYYLPNQYILR